MEAEQVIDDQTQQEYVDASRRGEERLRQEPLAIGARYDVGANLIVIELNRGYTLSFHPERAQVLANVSPEQLGEIEVSYPGLSIYFPRLDEDMGIDNMLRGRFGNDRWEAAWAEAHPVQAYVAQAEQSESAAA
jgi:hypothetical protein